MAPAFGTAPPDQVDDADQLPSLTACCAWALTVKKAVASNESGNEQWRKRMELPPDIPVFRIFRITGQINNVC